MHQYRKEYNDLAGSQNTHNRIGKTYEKEHDQE